MISTLKSVKRPTAVNNWVGVCITIVHYVAGGAHSLAPSSPLHRATDHESWARDYEHIITQTCTLLFSEAHCKQLESRVEKLVDLQDLEDELQHCRESLAVAERSLAR